VKDLSLAEFGRKEIRLAEHEMPGLMTLRTLYGANKPLAGARVMGSLHMTVQTAVLIETLPSSGRMSVGSRATSSRRRITRPPRWSCGRPETGGTPANPRGTPVYAWKGETLDEYWWCTSEALLWPDGSGPTQIRRRRRRRDAAAAQGRRVREGGEGAGVRRRQGTRGVGRHPRLLRQELKSTPKRWTKVAADTEGLFSGMRPPTGVHRLYEMMKTARCCSRRSTSTKFGHQSKFYNIYGCRHSLIDGLNRATDVMMGGKVAVVVGFGEVGKGLRPGAARQGCRVIVAEIDPIARCRRRWRLRSEAGGRRRRNRRHLRGPRPHLNIITVDMNGEDEHNAIIGNIGHLRQRDRHGRPEEARYLRRIAIKPQYDEFRFPSGKSVLILAGRAAAEPRLRDRPPELRDVGVVHQPGDRAAGTAPAQRQVREKVYILPKHLDEEVARLHLDHLGVKLTK